MVYTYTQKELQLIESFGLTHRVNDPHFTPLMMYQAMALQCFRESDRTRENRDKVVRFALSRIENETWAAAQDVIDEWLPEAMKQNICYY